MRYDRSGLPRITTLTEAAALQYATKVCCPRCGRTAVFDPHALWWLFHRKGWYDRLTIAARRFRCLTCRPPGSSTSRPPSVSVELVREQPTVDLPMPPQHEWNRQKRRMR